MFIIEHNTAESKIKSRNIEKINQSRNDFIEQIDSFIYERISKTILKKAKQNSETLGAMDDRLSILSLKIFHMPIQTRRENVSELPIQTCSKKLEALKIQRNDLCVFFEELFYDCMLGLEYFNQYKQFKMYNDPNLNPKLYTEKT